MFEVLEREDLGEDDLVFLYKTMISNFAELLKGFLYNILYTKDLFCLVDISISNRARSKIIQQWLDEEWGFTVGLQKIDQKARDLKLSLDRNPSYNEIYLAVEPLAQEKFNISQEKAEQIEDKHFHRIGINKLFTEVIGSDITVEPSYEDKLRLESAIENLDDREIDVINKRFGLHNESFEYGLTLEEIGQDYDVISRTHKTNN